MIFAVNSIGIEFLAFSFDSFGELKSLKDKLILVVPGYRFPDNVGVICFLAL